MANEFEHHAWAWAVRDESFYSFLKEKYKDRRKLATEAEEKRKAAEKMKDGDPHIHRMQISAEMAAMRLDMAYIVERNTQLEQYIETLEYLHQKVAILEGAYGHMKMLAETSRIDYAQIAKALKTIETLKEQK